MRYLTDLVPTAAERRPDGTAVIDGEISHTWADIADRCARLAAGLIANGVGPGDRVGVHLRKSAEAFIAMHAVVQSGAIAVPLDPSASPDYLVSIARETGCTSLVTHDLCRSSARQLATGTAMDVVFGIDRSTLDAEPQTRVVSSAEIAEFAPRSPAKVDALDAAYIITTSGSTGRPKGICHTHASALAHVRSMMAAYDFTCDDRFSDIAPNHFDISTLALWVTPAVGATNVVVREQYQMLPASLSALVASSRISVWYSVPYLLSQLLSRGAIERHDFSALRWVLFGGELFPSSTLADLMRSLPSTRFSNVYGPAEVNAVTVHHLDALPTDDETIPVGRALVGCEVRLVDTETHDLATPLANGASGEVWVRSDTMMRGYWQRPDLNDKSITADDAGRAWYRTGDLGHLDDTGRLVFTGRLDHQVKVRGHRIELEAVEAAIEVIAGITHTVATVSRRADGADSIIAGYITDDQFSLELSELMRLVGRALPAYAVPARFHPLSGTLPMTGSGKLNRRALRASLQLHDSEQRTPS